MVGSKLLWIADFLQSADSNCHTNQV